MNKFSIEKIYKELKKLGEKDIPPTFALIKEFFIKRLTSIQEEATERVNEIQENINQLK